MSDGKLTGDETVNISYKALFSLLLYSQAFQYILEGTPVHEALLTLKGLNESIGTYKNALVEVQPHLVRYAEQRFEYSKDFVQALEQATEQATKILEAMQRGEEVPTKEATVTVGQATVTVRVFDQELYTTTADEKPKGTSGFFMSPGNQIIH